MGERIGLSMGQTISCLVQGAILWLGAALLLRWLGPMGIYTDPLRIWVYLLIIPGTFPFVIQVEKLARLGRHQLFAGVGLVTMAALLLDGLALAWVPQLYGTTIELQAGAGAAILWGGGVGLALGWLRARPA